MVSDKTPGEFLVAICALIGESLLQPSGQLLALPALRLRETLRGLPEFVRMGNLLAGGQREEMQKAWSNANFPCSQRRNTVRVCVDAQAQIPARGTLDDPSTFEASSGAGWLVKADRPEAWHLEACSRRWLERIRQGHAGQSMAPSFALGLLGQLLIAPLPGDRGRIQHPLQRVAGYAELFAVIRKQVVEGFLTVAVWGSRSTRQKRYGELQTTRCQLVTAAGNYRHRCV
jgi:hypothetical protein